MSNKKINIKSQIERTFDMPIISIFLVLVLSILSFYATYQGFVAFFTISQQDQISQQQLQQIDKKITKSITTAPSISTKNTYEQLLIPIALTLVIQIAILLSVWKIKGGGVPNKFVWIFVYALCVFFSVSFAYAFWFEKLRAEDLGQELSKDSKNVILSPLYNYRTNYANLQIMLDKISYTSAKNYDIEVRFGKTCHPSIPKGDGPMAKYRKADSEIFSRLSNQINQEINRLNADIEHYKKIDITKYSPNEQQDILVDFTLNIKGKYNYKFHQENTIDVLQQQIIKASSAFKKDLKLCSPDVPIKQEFLKSVKAIKFSKEAQTSDIVLIDYNNKRDVLNYAFGGILNIVQTKLGFEPNKQNQRLYKTTFRDLIPLMLGLLVDIFIMLFTVRNNPIIADARRTIIGFGNRFDELIKFLNKDFNPEKLTKTFEQIYQQSYPASTLGNLFFHKNKLDIYLPVNDYANQNLNLYTLLEDLRHLKFAKRVVKDKIKAQILLPNVNENEKKIRQQTKWYVYTIDERILWELRRSLLNNELIAGR
ncbi:MAG: hypothetical protein DRQ51_09475 [Gammaproteobacteria bacterium]|nr:MAG: hypothetical protein DRQ51_09475 [Gammaproteobacteria bacterium]